MQGTLYLVGTPIGNLKDITFRAVEVLGAADTIACEDTRRTGRLLKEFGIKAKLISYHDHVESGRSDRIIELLRDGKDVAIVSDAGTPGIADPGFRAVTKALEAGADVVPVPGAVAFVTALSASGLPSDSLFFGGFLPSKRGERLKRLHQVKDIPCTLLFYEAPHRIDSSVSDCLEVLGDRKAAVAREITKLHEEYLRGKLSTILSTLRSNPRKGEMVLVIDRPGEEILLEQPLQKITERYGQMLNEGMEPKKALKTVAKEFNVSRSEAYRLVHYDH